MIDGLTACLIEKITLLVDLRFLIARSETDKGVTKDNVFARTVNRTGSKEGQVCYRDSWWYMERSGGLGCCYRPASVRSTSDWMPETEWKSLVDRIAK